MTTPQTIQTILEAAFGLIIILAAFHNDELVTFEDKIIEKIKRR